MSKLSGICAAIFVGSVTPTHAASPDWSAVSVVAPASLGTIEDMNAHVISISDSEPFGRVSCTLLDRELDAVAASALASLGFPKISHEETQAWRSPSFYVYLTAHAHDPIFGDPLCVLSGHATVEAWASATDASGRSLGDTRLLLWSTPTLLSIAKADEQPPRLALGSSQQAVASEELNQQAETVIRVLAKAFVDDWMKSRR